MLCEFQPFALDLSSPVGSDFGHRHGHGLVIVTIVLVPVDVVAAHHLHCHWLRFHWIDVLHDNWHHHHQLLNIFALVGRLAVLLAILG